MVQALATRELGFLPRSMQKTSPRLCFSVARYDSYIIIIIMLCMLNWWPMISEVMHDCMHVSSACRQFWLWNCWLSLIAVICDQINSNSYCTGPVIENECHLWIAYNDIILHTHAVVAKQKKITEQLSNWQTYIHTNLLECFLKWWTRYTSWQRLHGWCISSWELFWFRNCVLVCTMH